MSRLDPNLMCLAGDDSGRRALSFPAGQLDAVDSPVRPVVIFVCSEPPHGPGILSASICGQDHSIPNSVVWIVDNIHLSDVGADVATSIKERREFMGGSIVDIPVTLPFVLLAAPLDSASAMTCNVSWKVLRQSTTGRPTMPEVVGRRISSIAASGFAPVDPAVGDDLLFPIGSELASGLLTPDVSGFGWRPDELTVRKTDGVDNINVLVAQGALVGGKPAFGVINMPPGTNEWTGPVDPSWSGGVIIDNVIANPTSTILLQWKKT